MNNTKQQSAGNSTEKSSSQSQSQNSGTEKVAPEVTPPNKTPEVSLTPVIPEVIHQVTPKPEVIKPISEKQS